MLESLAFTAQPFLNQPYIKRTRRNHGLEHATVHVLSDKVKSVSMAGRSDAAGFWLFGDLQTPIVEQAVNEALNRMKNGERRLAVHPGCGTSYLTKGTVTGLAALGGTLGMKRSVNGYVSRMPMVAMLGVLGLFVAEPLGLKLQELFTTSGDLGDLVVTKIERKESNGLFGGGMILHRITTTST